MNREQAPPDFKDGNEFWWEKMAMNWVIQVTHL